MRSHAALPMRASDAMPLGGYGMLGPVPSCGYTVERFFRYRCNNTAKIGWQGFFAERAARAPTLIGADSADRGPVVWPFHTEALHTRLFTLENEARDL